MRTTYQFRGQTLSFSQTASRLKALALEGLRRRCPEEATRLAGRLCGELVALEGDQDMMQRTVILWDLARYAGVHQIPVRGEPDTASLTAYCLGIAPSTPEAEGWEPENLGLDQLRLRVDEKGWAELSAYLSLVYPDAVPEHFLERGGLSRDGPEDGQAQYAAAWLAELRRRLEQMSEQMPEDFNGVQFEYWMDKYVKLSQQVQLVEDFLRRTGGEGALGM